MLVNMDTKGKNKSEQMEKIDHCSSRLHVIMESLQESKVEDICHIENTPARSLVCDNMVIVSGKSSKHVTSIADNLVAYLKKHNIEVLGIEGLLSANWVLIDVGDIMVHVFHSESRKLYDLESMWI